MEPIQEQEALTLKDIVNIDNPEAFLIGMQPYRELMMQYRCALMEVETKLNVLNEEFAMKYSRNPFEHIQSRIKSPASIFEKLKRRGLEVSLESIEQNLFDIAGIRVICSFEDDIYAIARMLTVQDDIILVRVKDYIKNPKPNGYRSLHLIVDIPIFLAEEKKHMKVEVQLRTIAMDFWASLEHKLKYKKDIQNQDRIMQELKECADVISATDKRMQNIRDMIERDAEGRAKKAFCPIGEEVQPN